MRRIHMRKNSNRFLGLFIVVLLTALWRVFDRRSRERIPGQEGIEDPEMHLNGYPERRKCAGYAILLSLRRLC
jgi:hypothetical protein